MLIAHRYHDFSYGHRVYKHESKCAHLHGHNGRVTFHCEAPELDSVGRVIDFSCIKQYLCNWVEDNWDHKFLIFKEDPWAYVLKDLDSTVVYVPFNPTSENMAKYLLDVVGPQQLKETGVTLVKVEFSETRKCGCTVEVDRLPQLAKSMLDFPLTEIANNIFVKPYTTILCRKEDEPSDR